MAAHSQYFPAHQTHHLNNLQTRPQQTSTFMPQHYDYMGQPFANQTAPWTSEQPPRNPNVPRSSISFFDPATDPTDYSAFVPHHVDLWATQYTDPNFLLSPNEPVVPPQELFTMATQSMAHRQQYHGRQLSHGQVQSQAFVPDSSPVELRFHRASPSPDSQNFVNYNAASSLITESYTAIPQQHLSPIDTSIELPDSVALRSPTSPMASASSPGGSDGMYSSYQHSDPGLDPQESQPYQSFNNVIPPPSSVADAELSPNATLQDSSTGGSPEPESQLARRQVGPIRTTGRPGGRALGTHLEPKVAKAAHDMRKIVACWHCVLQRDKVSMLLVVFSIVMILTPDSAVLETLASVA